MSPLVGHILLALAAGSLAGAGFRAASATGARGLQRAIAAAALAAAAAVAEALLLGLVAWGGSPAALTVAAVATYAAARVLLPDPELALAPELRGWFARLVLWERAALGAALGAGVAWTAWTLAYPALGHDMILYHVPEAVAWTHNGRPGSIEPIVDAIPVGNYPLTDEVLMGWGTAISHGLAWVTLVTPAAIVLMAASVWTGLRTIAVPRLAAALAAAALVLLPATIASQSGGGSLDPAALAWLAACAALCAGAWRGRPLLLAPALVAAGLAAGTKTTALPLALLVVAVTLVAMRRSLRAGARLYGAAALGAVAVGGVWYLRDLLDRGSPLWPFVPAPWGDPQPANYKAAGVSLLDRPGATISRLGDYYLHHFAGGIALLAGAVLVAVLVRPRELLAAGAATVVSLLLWAQAPFTGVLHTRAFDPGTGDATRYLLPGLAAAVLTLGLAARTRGHARGVAVVALAAAAALAARDTFALGFPSAPSLRTPVAGALAGAAVLAALGALPRARLRVPRAVGVAALVGVGALGALASHGWDARHARAGLFDADLVRWFQMQPDWRSGDRAIAVSGSIVAPLTGNRVRHPLRLFRVHGSCPRPLAPAGTGWLVVDRAGTGARLARNGLSTAQRSAASCVGRRPAAHVDSGYAVYRLSGP